MGTPFLADIFGPDLLIVILVVVVLLFGGAAIPKLARNLGSAQSEFKKGLNEPKGSADNSAADNKASDTPAPEAPTPDNQSTGKSGSSET